MRIGLAIAVLVAAHSAMASPIVIAHRGASADRPEHTLAAYRLAIEQGADFIEPDLVPTKDGHLVARHENEISGTTDIANRPEFASRRTTKTIDGEQVTGWFTEDLTLRDIKTLRARERLPQLRPANTAFDKQETVPTLEEIIELVKTAEARTGRRIGLYPETKHPSYFRYLGLSMEARLLKVLNANGYNDEHDGVFIQSFEIQNLKLLNTLTKLKLIQLVAPGGAPADQSDMSYAAMLTPGGLKQIASYADGIGAEKSLVIPRDPDGTLGHPTGLVDAAHKAGLAVHLWTFRPENHFLPTDMRSSGDATARGDAEAEVRAFLATGIDGLFSDSVPPAVAARARFLQQSPERSPPARSAD